MKRLVILLLLVSVNDNQALAGKKLASAKRVISKNFKTVVAPLMVGTAGTAGSFLLLNPIIAVPLGGSIALVTGIAILQNKLREWDGEGDTTISYRDKEILYRHNDELKRAKVFFHHRIGQRLSLDGGESIALEDVVAMLIPDHHDVGREVELLTESDDTEALHYAGFVVGVFDDGFYELEVVAKTDLLPDPWATDSTLRHYANIEPHRIIVGENVSFQDGGFRFAGQGTRQALYVKKLDRLMQNPKVLRALIRSHP